MPYVNIKITREGHVTPERLARLEEAEKHPNEEDFARAKAWAKEMADLAAGD